MKRWPLAVLLVISLGVNIGFVLRQVWPRLGPEKTKMEAGWQTDPMKRHLGLSAEQATRMEGERKQVVARVQPWQEELSRKRAELFALIKKQDAADQDLDQILGEIARLQTAIEKEFILHSRKVRGGFDPAQLRKFEGCLERELCPGMRMGPSCASRQSAGDTRKTAGCSNPDENKNTDPPSKPKKEVE